MTPARAAAAKVDTVRQCARAQDLLVQKVLEGVVFVDEAIPKNGTLRAWGQYLALTGEARDELAGQFGVFGTTAAVQMLALAGLKDYEASVRAGIQVLPLVTLDNDLPPDALKHREYFAGKGDLDTTFKVAALLDTAVAIASGRHDSFKDVDPALAVGRLFEMAKPGGWADYQAPLPVLPPNPHATAVALLSLSETDLTEEQVERCRNALADVARKFDAAVHSIATIAMLAIATDRLVKLDDKVDSKAVTTLRDECFAAITAWVRVTAPAEIRRSLEGMEHWRPRSESADQNPKSHRFDVLFYVPHCLATFAIVHCDGLWEKYPNRSFANAVVKLVAAEICQGGGAFVAAGRPRISTVETLWIYRMLEGYRNRAKNRSWQQRVFDPLRERRFVLTVALLVAATVGCGIAAALTKGIMKAVWGAIGGVLVTFVARLVERLLRESGRRS